MTTGVEVATQPSATSLAMETLPYLHIDTNKHRYLSFRVCGFTIREAATLAGVRESTVREWRRSDAQFKELETVHLGALREKYSNKYVEVEFLRNYRLILEKDLRVIRKSIDTPDDMSAAENSYLKAARSHYTPQQLATLKEILGEFKPVDNGTARNFSYTQFILDLSRRFSEETDIKEIRETSRHASVIEAETGRQEESL